MEVVILKTNEVPEPPPDVRVTDNFGHVAIQKNGRFLASGDHIIAEGAPEAIKRWLQPLDGVWVGVGPPMLQQFEVRHIQQ